MFSKRLILEIKVNVCGYLRFSLIFDSQFPMNFITYYVVEWKKRNSYYAEKENWVDKNVKVHFHEVNIKKVWCDVPFIETCYICLVNPWFQSHKVFYEEERYKYVMNKRRKLLFPPISLHQKTLGPYSMFFHKSEI